MVSGPSVHAEMERRQRWASRLTEKDVARELGTSHHNVGCLRERGLLTAERGRDNVWSFDTDSVQAVAEALSKEREEAELYMAVGEAARRFGLAVYQFEKVFLERVRGRTLLVTRQRQYLRSDVEALVTKRVG
jgi:hypothetical protein